MWRESDAPGITASGRGTSVGTSAKVALGASPSPVLSFTRNATVSSHIRHDGRDGPSGQASFPGSRSQHASPSAASATGHEVAAPADKDVQRPVAVSAEARTRTSGRRRGRVTGRAYP